MLRTTSLRMLPLDLKHRWVFVAILFFGIFIKNNKSSDTNDTCRQTNVLFVSAVRLNHEYPSKAVYHEVNGSKLCFAVHGNRTNVDAVCCHEGDFNCSVEIKGSENDYKLILNKETLSKQDIVFMAVDDKFDCMPQAFYNTTSGFHLNIHQCINKGNKNIRFSQNRFCGKSRTYDEDACKGLAETEYIIDANKGGHCVSCKVPGEKPDVSITIPPPECNNGTGISLDKAAQVSKLSTTTLLESTATFRNIMNNLFSLLEELGNSSTATITIGHIKGVITKLPAQNQTNINFGIKTSGDIKILEGNDSVTGFSRSVRIPTEASVLAKQGNGSFAAALLFPGMHPDDDNSFYLNNEIVGIEMGAEVSNLSHTIDIHYRSVDKNGSIASCRSWDGKGKEANWITDGCQTKETTDSVTCQCSHLTFFAILMSSPPRNISSSDFKSLTYITSIGCGLSIFFLAVALCMHCLIRKVKASQATKILMNLFVAMLTLNLSFLVNESIAKLGNFGACVAVAAVMHYTMLATITWFFVEALHLFLILRKLPTDVKHYMTKICITGWVTPAVVVIALLASGQYNYMVIYTDDGNSAKMCWISDAVVHQGVNVGYYAVVFVFTFVIFIMTVRQIVLLKPAAGKAQDNGSIKTNAFSIMALFLLLGITWAFAFFSYGPMLVASYYIFTILNSFQGFFLFIYYFKSRKIAGGEGRGGIPTVSSSTATSNTVVTSP